MTLINLVGGSSDCGRTLFSKVLIEFIWSCGEDVSIVDCDLDKATLSRSYTGEESTAYRFGPLHSEDFYRLDDLLTVANELAIVVDLPKGQNSNVKDWILYALDAADDIMIIYWYLIRPNFKNLKELESFISSHHSKGSVEVVYVRNLVEEGWDFVETVEWKRFLADKKVMSIDFPALSELEAELVSTIEHPISSIIADSRFPTIHKTSINEFLKECYYQLISIYPTSPF